MEWLKKIGTSRWLPWSLLLVLAVFAMRSRGEMNWERISRQNAEAALDSTRSISTKRGEVYARIISQKDVQLAGALADAAKLRGLQPKLGVGVVVQGGGVDTTAVHHRPGGVVSPVGAAGLQRGNGVHAGAAAVLTDSLVLNGPPVQGVVSASVQDSTWYWSAHLKPSPVPLDIGLGCGKNGPEITAHGPTWVEIEVTPGQVDPKVCNPPKLHTPLVVKAAAAVGFAVVVVKVVQVVKSLIP